MRKIKAISLWEPWATGIALRLKNYETRGYDTQVRGELLICAAQKNDRENMPFFFDLNVLREFEPFKKPGLPYSDILSFGKAVAVVNLTATFPTLKIRNSLSGKELMFGNYESGRFAWKMENIRRIKEPFPVKGKQGFFFVDMPEEVEFV